MDLIDQIRILQSKARADSVKPMRHVYLGYEQMAEMSALLGRDPYKGVSCTTIHGLHVVPVIKQSHLAVGP